MNEPGIADPQSHIGSRRRRPAISRGLVALVLAVIAIAAVAITVLPTLITHPTFVPRVSVANGTDYDVKVTVGKQTTATQVSLGAAAQQCTTAFEQVADQGSTWVFRFEAQGIDAGSVTVDRATLEAASWTVTMPPEVASRLVEARVPLPPHRDCGSAPVP
jgi:hypothetical protein